MSEICIIVPVYNVGKTLAKCLDSLLNQSFTDLEILLINDGSTDESLKICELYSKKDNRIKVITQKNQGVSVARNTGIKEASSKYIGFVDPDDWIEPHMYESLYESMKLKNSEIGICSYFIERGLDKEVVDLFIGEDFIECEEIKSKIVAPLIFFEDLNNTGNKLMGSVWRLLIEKKFLMQHKLFFQEGVPLMEDLIFCISLFSNASKVSILNEPLYHYIISNNSASTKYRENLFAIQHQVLSSINKIIEADDSFLFLKNRFALLEHEFRINAIINVCNSNLNVIKCLRLIRNMCHDPYIYYSDQIINTQYLPLKTKLTIFLLKYKLSMVLLIYYKVAIYRNEK